MENPHIGSPDLQSRPPSRLIVGITGASGVILGVRLLEALRSTSVETHLILSASAPLTIKEEIDRPVEEILSVADVVYDVRDMSVAIASGSYATMGMVIIPCSIKTLSAVANSYSNDLIARAADVTLKEGRPLILVVRESPYHQGHLLLMKEASDAGAIIFPPVPAFYTHPKSVDDIVNNIVGHVLARLNIQNDLYHEWLGT